jgi:hypothetical protein
MKNNQDLFQIYKQTNFNPNIFKLELSKELNFINRTLNYTISSKILKKKII